MVRVAKPDVDDEDPGLSADIASAELAAEAVPDGGEFLLPVSAVPRRTRGEFFSTIGGVDLDSLSAYGDGKGTLAALAVVEVAAAAFDEALRLVARPGAQAALAAVLDGADAKQLVELGLWYMVALRPGEAVPSPS
jgi:hypothetical protein